MLGFLKPRGELVEISGRTVVFLSLKAFKMDQKFEVKLGLPEPPGQTITVAVRVLSCRPGPADFFVVVGIAEGRRELPNLKGYPLRNYARAPHRITVKSEGLPSYRAVTSNLGRGGFGAELDGELPDGKLLNVHLEFDEPLGWTLELKARVAWTIWKSQNRYDTGFEFLEDPAFALPLEQLAAWCSHMASHELVPFKPPDRMPERRPNQLPNQLPQAHQIAPPPPQTGMPFAQPAFDPAAPIPPMPSQSPASQPGYTESSEVHRAVMGMGGIDDDPTPLGLPTLVQPPSRPTSLKLPGLTDAGTLQRPSSFQLQSVPEPSPPQVSSPDAPTVRMRSDEMPPMEDPGVRIHFEATLRGWAWEGADDAIVVVLEDIHGTDHWLEFPQCRGMQGRCRQREIRLLGMAVASTSTLIDELSRYDGETALMHYRLYDDHQRVVLDIVATECREQIR